jgi:hypothetical protein
MGWLSSCAPPLAFAEAILCGIASGMEMPPYSYGLAPTG